MRKAWTPSIVPGGIDQNIYLVIDDLGRLGRVWRETDAEHTDLETVIKDLLDGQYHSPVGVFGFNPAEGWSRDVSEDVAREIRRALRSAGRGRAVVTAGFCRAARRLSLAAIDLAAGLSGSAISLRFAI